jgi:hypothetical protein
MFDSMMRLVEQQNADGAIRRPEFDLPRPSETSLDDKSRAELIAFIDRATPDRHKVQLADGRTAVVFFDQRGRATSAVLDDLDDDTLNWILQSKNMRGEPLPNSDPGYPQPVEESRSALRSPSDDEVKALRDFVREVGGKGYSVKQNKTVQGASVKVSPPYPLPESGGGAIWVKIAKWLIQNGWVQFPDGGTEYLEKQQAAAEKYDSFYALGNLMKRGGVSEEAEATTKISTKARTAMEKFIYAKLPPDTKMKKGGRMLTIPAGTWAEILGVKSYTGVYMDEIPDDKLTALAKRWGYKGQTENIARGASEKAKSFDVAGGSMHTSMIGDEPVTSWNVATADGTKVAIVVKGGAKATGGGSGVAEVFWPGMKSAGFRGRVMMSVNGAIKLKREIQDTSDAELPALVRKYRTEESELAERSDGPVRHSRDYMDPTVEIFTVSIDDMDQDEFERWLRHRGIRGKVSKIGKNLQVVVAEGSGARGSAIVESKPIKLKVKGYEITATPEGRDYDVSIFKNGSLVVTGMYDAGGLTLSDYSPDGKKVALRDSLVDAFEDAIKEAIDEQDDD